MFFFGTPRKVGVLYNITVSPFSNLKGVFLFVSGGFQPGHRKAAPFRRLSSKLQRGDMPKWRFYKALFPRGQGHPPRNFEVQKAQQKTPVGVDWCGVAAAMGSPRVSSPHLVGGNLSPKYFHQNLKPAIFSWGPVGGPRVEVLSAHLGGGWGLVWCHGDCLFVEDDTCTR